MFLMLSPGPLGIFVGPNIWYKKKTQSPMATKPNTRIGRAIAILLIVMLVFPA